MFFAKPRICLGKTLKPIPCLCKAKKFKLGYQKVSYWIYFTYLWVQDKQYKGMTDVVAREVGTKSEPSGDIQVGSIYIEIYDSLVVSYVGDSSAEILNQVEIDWAYDDCDMDFRGYTDYCNDPDHLITILMLFVRPYICPGVISHECLHAVNFITDHLSIKDEESKAYLLDYLVNKQHLFFKKDLISWYPDM